MKRTESIEKKKWKNEFGRWACKIEHSAKPKSNKPQRVKSIRKSLKDISVNDMQKIIPLQKYIKKLKYADRVFQS